MPFTLGTVTQVLLYMMHWPDHLSSVVSLGNQTWHPPHTRVVWCLFPAFRFFPLVANKSQHLLLQSGTQLAQLTADLSSPTSHFPFPLLYSYYCIIWCVCLTLSAENFGKRTSSFWAKVILYWERLQQTENSEQVRCLLCHIYGIHSTDPCWLGLAVRRWCSDGCTILRVVLWVTLCVGHKEWVRSDGFQGGAVCTRTCTDVTRTTGCLGF